MFHADASAAIVEDGKVRFAVAEERLNRRKHFAGFPALAAKACLDAVGATIADVAHVAVGHNSDAQFAEKFRYALVNPGKLLNLVKMRRRKAPMRDLRRLLARTLDSDVGRLKFREHHIEHHVAHIASAFYCSPWERAAGFSYDGSGDFVSTMLARCEGSDIQVLDRVFLPHSLGSFYSMICAFIGYRECGDEGKVMGLAPYGKDTYVEQVRSILACTDSGFRLDLGYFQPLGSNQGMEILPDGAVRLPRHFSDKMTRVFGAPREPHAPITQRDMDLAYAMQHCFEEVFFHSLNTLYRRDGQDRLAMAGGCALNSVANGKLFARTPFRQTWIQPAAGDDGLAIGAALYTHCAILKEPRAAQTNHAYLGPEFSESQIAAALGDAGVSYRRLERQPLLDAVSDEMARGKVVGWFQGRMEWGARALGNRSIVAHPGLPGMKDALNTRIKHREWFRPFAPAVLAEAQSEYFEQDHPSPHMMHVYKIRPDQRARLCAVTHVDDTGRLQTVSRGDNALFYDLIRIFGEKTGIPVIVNTSFNENEPIVCAPKEAIDCFVRTRMDLLAIGPFVASKSDPPRTSSFSGTAFDQRPCPLGGDPARRPRTARGA